MQEFWKNIPNYQGYQVSNFGRVRTHNKISYTDKHGERHWKDRILKQKLQCRKNGRKDYRVDLWKEGKSHTLLVSRLVAFTFYDKEINDKTLTVNHKNGDSSNNYLNNLEIIPLKENIQHGFNKGLYSCAKKIKLTNKLNNYNRIYRSMAEASEVMERSKGYISHKIKKGIFEDKIFKWEIYECGD